MRTHRVIGFLGLIALNLLPAPLRAQAPSLLNYQGRVAVNGTNVTGTGQFQFALLADGSLPVWSNGAAMWVTFVSPRRIV